MANRKRYGHWIVCKFCRKGGGTLVKVEDGTYKHPNCSAATVPARKPALLVPRQRPMIPSGAGKLVLPPGVKWPVR